MTLADLRLEHLPSETGASFEENALIKARDYAAKSRLLTLADDSGLEVDALGGAPGIYSARYAGEGASDADRIKLLLKNLKDVPSEKRTARFRCVIAIAEAAVSQEGANGLSGRQRGAAPLLNNFPPCPSQGKGDTGERVAKPQPVIHLFTGECEGIIIFEPRGTNGFGYDPVFYMPEFGRTMAELSEEEKNRASHRARAAQQAREYLASSLPR